MGVGPNQKMTLLCSDNYSDEKGRLDGLIFGFECLIHKNFVFVGLITKFVVLDLNKNGELIGEYFVDISENSITNIDELLLDFDDDELLIKDHNKKCKLLRYKNNDFEFVGYFPFYISKNGLLKLNDNKFIIYSGNEFILYKKLNN